MKDIKVIVLNSHGVGQYAYCNKAPAWGESLAVRNWHIAKDGGKGSNVACALGMLGVKTAYIGKVGCDPWGDLGKEWMEEVGVDTSYMYRDKSISTGTGLVLIGPDGQNMVIDGEGSGVALTEEEIIKAIDAMGSSKYFITGFEIPYTLALKGAKHAHSLAMTTVLNPSPVPDEEIEELTYVDFLFVNEIEAQTLLNSRVGILEMANSLKKKYACKNIVITLGKDGCFCLDESGNTYSIKGVEVDKVVNTAGAGDGFMAACVYSLLNNKNLEQALTWSNYYAALAVTFPDTIPSYRTAKEVEAFIVKKE